VADTKRASSSTQPVEKQTRSLWDGVKNENVDTLGQFSNMQTPGNI